LSYLKIWHDNSGKGANASWFLKYAIAIDLQTKEKFYFLCEKWLAVDKDDGMIDRVLPASGDLQKKKFKYLLKKQAKYKITDGHLWISVFARPAMSSFTRIDRLTCCFVFLFINMLMNIMYYDTDKNSNPNGLKIGPLYITPEQVFFFFFINTFIRNHL
jgi:polycystin 1L2